MKKYLLIWSLLLFTAGLSYGQTIAFQDFEGGSDNWNFTANPATFNASGDVWAIVDDSWQNTRLTTMASSGSNFWGISDLANSNGTLVGEFGTLTFIDIDVSGHSNIQLSFDYDVYGYDNGDDIKYEVFFDETGQGEVLLVDGGGVTVNGTVVIPIPNGTGTVGLVLSVVQNGSDYAGFDNFRIGGAVAADPEPTNHASAFSVTADGHNKVDLAWTDADGAQLPAGYLVKGSDVSFADITDPVDGTPEVDGGLVLNVAQGVQAASFLGLNPETTYFFKIYPFSNSDAATDYKTDATVPQGSDATGAAPMLPNAWINEFHYDDAGTDANEIVEILIENAASYTISDFQVDLYNGNGGASYKTKTLDAYTVGDILVEDGKTFTLYFFNYSTDGGLQNGHDGIALSYQGNLIQFISYEGSLTATNGPANGIASTDIGIVEASAPEGSSLGLEGTGTKYSDFTWVAFEAAATPGSKNNTQLLPVELTSFTAAVIANAVKLAWNTATELNNYGFEVQRSIDSEEWTNVGFVNGSGNSSAPKSYSYTDSKLSNSSSYYYRLKQVDNDGAFEYSDVIEVVLTTAADYKLGQNYPNPFNPSTVISFTIPEQGYTKLTVFNSLGQEVKSLVNQNLEAGTHNINFNAGNLSSGIYYYKLEANNFVQINKMMLLK